MSDLESFSNVLPRIKELTENSTGYEYTARRAWGDEGTELICPSCKIHRHASTSEMAEIMRKGFPRCKRCSVRVKVREKYD